MICCTFFLSFRVCWPTFYWCCNCIVFKILLCLRLCLLFDILLCFCLLLDILLCLILNILLCFQLSILLFFVFVTKVLFVFGYYIFCWVCVCGRLSTALNTKSVNFCRRFILPTRHLMDPKRLAELRLSATEHSRNQLKCKLKRLMVA